MCGCKLRNGLLPNSTTLSTPHGGLQTQEGQGQTQGNFQKVRQEHQPRTPPQARTMPSDIQQYVQQSVRLQNEIISGVITDIDKLRSMMLQIHQEQLYIKKVFLHPQPPVVKRPVSVPTRPIVGIPSEVPKVFLPKIPRPPTANRPKSRAPRKLQVQPNMVF